MGQEALRPMSLGPKIRALRQTRGWFISKLASDCNMSTGHLSKIEREKSRRPRESTLRCLAEKLESPVLLELAGEYTPKTQTPSKQRFIRIEGKIDRIIAHFSIPEQPANPVILSREIESMGDRHPDNV